MMHRKPTNSTRSATYLIALCILSALAIVWTAVRSDAQPQQHETTHAARAHVRPATQVSVVSALRPQQWHGLRQVVKGWNRSPLVHLTITDRCEIGTYCVFVDAYDHGDSNWMGLTTTLSPRMAHAQLNLHWAGDKRQQSATICHELGHALGIAHPDGTEDPNAHGCIAAPHAENTTPTPSDADRAKLVQLAQGYSEQGWGALAQ